MSSSTVTSKGQITIPVDVRRDLGLRPGSRVTFVRGPSGAYEMRIDGPSIRALRGIVAPLSEPVSLEEMDRAIAEGAS